MLQPGRSFSNGKYRYGFNGKENDDEVKGIEGSQQDYGMRIYDPRVGRFLSVDPLINKYPQLTPYQFSSNSPVAATDVDGAEADWLTWKVAWWVIRIKLGLENAGKTYASNIQTYNRANNNNYGQFDESGKSGSIQDQIDANKKTAALAKAKLAAQTSSAMASSMQFASTPFLIVAPEFNLLQGTYDFYQGNYVSGSLNVLSAGFGAWMRVAAIPQSASAFAEGNTIINKAANDGVKVVVAQTKDDIAYLNQMGSRALYMEGQGTSGSILVTQGSPGLKY
jgi:RHS repeat-associated protein